jgi:hypothetical protein
MYVCVSAKTERAPHLSPSEESEIQAKPTTRPALSYTHTHSPRPAAAGGTKRTKRGAAGHAAKGPRSTPARKGRQETVHGRDREKASTSTSPNENDPWPGLAWPYNNNKKDLNFGRCNISTSRGLSRLEQYIWSTIASLPVLFKQKKRVFFVFYLYVSFGATHMTHKACIFIVGCIHLSTVVIISMAAVAYVRETGE